MRYYPPYGSVDPEASYVDKDVPGAVRGSAVPAKAVERPQREIVGVIAGAGLVPADGNQLATAIQSGGLIYAVAGGTANALTAALPLAPAALVPGFVINVMIAANNTGAATLSLNGLAPASIKTLAGAALQRDDMVGGAIMNFVWSGTAWLLGGGLARSEVPKIPTADIVLYVRTDGNDNNDGAANTSARAFATVQKAIDFLTTRFSSSANYAARVVLGNTGTYAAAINRWYPGSITIEGSGDAYILTGGDISVGAPCAFASRAGRVVLKNLRLINTASSGVAFSVASLGGSIGMDTVAITSALSNSSYIPIYIAENGVLSIINQFVLNGGDGTTRTMRALIQVGTGGVFNGAPTATTAFIATSNWVAGFIEASMTGVAIFSNITLSPSGSFTGPRYSAVGNGVINTNGGGANFFPGNSAGTTATGGQYL